MKRSAWTFWIASMLLGTPALAFNWMYQANEPGPYMLMSDADRSLLQTAMQQALDEHPDGQALSWKSSESDAHGSIVPLSTFERHGMHCRKLRFETHAKGESGRGEYSLCKTKDGTWALAD